MTLRECFGQFQHAISNSINGAAQGACPEKRGSA
jgi:hypothetical protein